jgi:endonuclease G
MTKHFTFRHSAWLLPLLFWNAAHAHPGNVNAEGCHTNHKTGEYHCHEGRSRAPTHSPAIQRQETPEASSIVTPTPNLTSSDVLKLDYDGFTVWLDCKERAAIRFRYNAQRDNGNLKRLDKFALDPNVPASCQQYTSKAYGKGYQRGHQVPANHLDASINAIHQSNYMTNILPQTSQMNRGAWLLTEEIVECYRDISELLVMGGVIWGNDTSNDLFISSHGVRTPDFFYKVVIRGTGADERAIAWIVPNSVEATKRHLDDYLVTVDELEKLTGESFPVADYAKHDKPAASWLIPHGCNKS